MTHSRITILLLCSLLLVAVSCTGSESSLPTTEGTKTPLPGQIIVDPDNPSYLVYNRDADGNGKLDPFFLIGPGDPEGFLYLGTRQEDGTRNGGSQLEIINTLREHGGNGIYFQAVRSHGGDGEPDHNPWLDPADPSSGLNPAVIEQWRGWFDQMRDSDITLFFFIYDDGSHPFDDGCTGTVSQAEHDFIRDLVEAVENYPNLIWVIQEEFKFVGQTDERRPCNDMRITKAGLLADLVKQYDDYGHAVGVHHNIGDDMAFPDHPSVDIYVQQAYVVVQEDKGNLETLHQAGLPGNGFDPQNRYVYIMGEAYNWHHALMEAKDRSMLRKSYYASAMAGGGVMVLGMYGAEGPPTVEMLQDMRRMQSFFESNPFNEMAPADSVAYGDTQWALADRERHRYILYTSEGPGNLGVRELSPGSFSLTWFDPVTGNRIDQNDVQASGDVTFEKPSEIGSEVLLYLRPTER